MDAAADLLANAKRPVIMAGDAVAQSRAHAELVELAELLGAPVYTEFVPSTASFPASHPLFRGSMIRLAPDVRKVLDQYDVLFSVGGDLFTLSLPSDVDPMPPGIKLIHLDSRSLGARQELSAGGRHPRRSEGDAAGYHRRRARAHDQRGARRRARAARERQRLRSPPSARRCKAKARSLAGATPVQPLALLNAIGEMLPKDAVVIEEALSSAPGIRQLIRSDDPQSYFGLRGGGIGWGLPATIGVKLALPDRPVVGLIGDGSAMYTVQGLWTAARYRIDAVFVILNNTSYRILKQRLHNMRGLSEQADNYVGMELVDPEDRFRRACHARSASRPSGRRRCTRRPICWGTP